MAAIYDALGNYVGDDGAGAGNTPVDIAKMRATVGAKLEARSPLARPKSAAMQQLEAIDAKPLSIDDIYYRLTTPLTKPISRFESLQRDISSLPQQISDVTNTLFGNPFQMAVRTPIEALITGQTSTPQVNALIDKNVAPMQTPQGMEFASSIGKAFEASKLPHAWPAIPNAPRRPMLAGSDIRAMKGDVARLATQMGEIGPDFQAAQTGFTRIDPITGKPTMGARLQSLADDWAGVMERRQSLQDELAPLAELASPEMYAVRKKGTRLIEPTKPETATSASFTVDPATNVIRTVVGGSREMSPYAALANWRDKIESEMPNAMVAAMRQFATQQKMEMFPGLDVADAKRAFDRTFADRESNAAKTMELYTEYLNSPEGRAVAEQTGANIVTPIDFTQRHAAAVDWLQGPFSNYLVRNVGAEGDPLVGLAAQGLTYESPNVIREAARYAEGSDLQEARQSAGLPPEGTVAVAAQPKIEQLRAAQDELNTMLTQADTLRAQAQERGVDPATIPEYAAMTNPMRVKARQVQQLEKEVENLKTGMAYETLSDYAVATRTPEQFLKQQIQTYEAPFYPSATRAAADEPIYVGHEGSIGSDLRFENIVRDFYNDVLQGNITPDQLKNLTVEKYVRKGAEKRIAREAQQAKEQQQAKVNVANIAKEQLDSAQITLPKTKVIEITDAMSPEEITKLISLDTEILDHCIGNCGVAPDTARNLFRDSPQRYKPIFDFAKDKFDTRKALDEYDYVAAIRNGQTKIGSIRDAETGLPVATVEIKRIRPYEQGKVEIGFISGYDNKLIDPQYHADVVAYLNQYADKILHISSALRNNVNAFDTLEPAHMKKAADVAARRTGISELDIRRLDFNNAPRFMTQEQFNEFVLQNQDDMVPTTAPIVAPESAINQGQQLDTLYRDFLDAVDMAIDEGTFDPNDYSNAELAQLVLDDEVGGNISDISQAEREALANIVREHGFDPAYRPSQQLPATPEEVNIGGFETDWTDINNRDALLTEMDEMPDQIRRMSNNALAEFLTPADFGEAGGILEHLREQLDNMIDATDDEASIQTTVHDYTERIREEPVDFFGEISPYILEYALRAFEAEPRPGYAKGGAVKKKVQMTKSIPAMRAELLRRA